MKKLFFTCIAAVLLGAGLAQEATAQYRAPRRAPQRSQAASNTPNTVIKVNVLSPFVLTGSGFIEHAFSPRISGQIGAFVTGASISDVNFKGYGFTPEVRYYLSENKEAPAGPYVAGYSRIQNFKLTVQDESADKEYTATYKPIGAGVAIGNQWIFNNHIALDIFLGGGYNGGSLQVNTGTEQDFDTGWLDILGSGFRIRPGLTVGYSF
ncbi:DUF3575 domain-containing protein [Pontibacter harenae]|uniref:DUF3575 domain-containing protein n=1 Tax=Pontibacter harenae TaxID=2894083 RepID=UPI001E4BD2F0|nr:DUF3575 domain-containing protein [Pontibacter harenae]MCC9165333.1 DUF3575 domain-containing protein [Pontibacter harenae]